MTIPDDLRRAATLMRIKAKAARTGDGDSLTGTWLSDRDGRKWCDVFAECEGTIIAQQVHRVMAEHIAGMDPAVALAVADWLHAAADYGHHDTCELAARKALPAVCTCPYSSAVRAANAYLGRDPA